MLYQQTQTRENEHEIKGQKAPKIPPKAGNKEATKNREASLFFAGKSPLLLLITRPFKLLQGLDISLFIFGVGKTMPRSVYHN